MDFRCVQHFLYFQQFSYISPSHLTPFFVETRFLRTSHRCNAFPKWEWLTMFKNSSRNWFQAAWIEYSHTSFIFYPKIRKCTNKILKKTVFNVEIISSETKNKQEHPLISNNFSSMFLAKALKFTDLKKNRSSGNTMTGEILRVSNEWNVTMTYYIL